MTAPSPGRPRVCFTTLVLTRYRVPFHERVRERLASDGIEYQLIYGAPVGPSAARQDTADLPWATRIATRRLSVAGRDLYWQPLLQHTRAADLTIASQENKLLANYLLQLRQVAGRERFAFWGHGRNLQSNRPDGPSERLKRHLATRAHWWFAYTEGTRRFLGQIGFPDDRITVFNNAIDLSSLADDRAALSSAEIAAFRQQHGLGAGPVCLYLGALYADKRLDYLLEAARLIHDRIPGFRLLVAGSGPEAGAVESFAARHDFVRCLGPRFGRDKALCAAASDLLLLPAAVGLAVLDSFALGLPLVTVADQGHGPEIDYLRDGGNGMVLPAGSSPRDYAEAIETLLGDRGEMERLAAGARRSAAGYSIDAMADAFCAGVRAALDRP